MTASAPASPIRLFTADEVDAMVRAGILGEDEPLELLEGVLETMSPQSNEHAWIKDFLARRLEGVFEPSRAVRTQNPLVSGELSRPEPDIMVLCEPLARYRDREPCAQDAILVVEVSVSTLERDHRKASVYGRAGVPVLWILDVEGRRLEVHTDPGPEGYGVVTLLSEHKDVSVPETDLRWKIADLLG